MQINSASEEDYDKFLVECRGVGSMLGAIIKNPKAFLIKKTL